MTRDVKMQTIVKEVAKYNMKTVYTCSSVYNVLLAVYIVLTLQDYENAYIVMFSPEKRILNAFYAFSVKMEKLGIKNIVINKHTKFHRMIGLSDIANNIALKRVLSELNVKKNDFLLVNFSWNQRMVRYPASIYLRCCKEAIFIEEGATQWITPDEKVWYRFLKKVYGNQTEFWKINKVKSIYVQQPTKFPDYLFHKLVEFKIDKCFEKVKKETKDMLLEIFSVSKSGEEIRQIEIWNDVILNSKAEYESLVAYIKGFNLNGDIAVVDIGWRGSMQLFLERILRGLNFENKIYGYYITLSSSMYRGMDMYGYLQNVDNMGKGCDLLRGYTGLIELMFMCSEGSVLRYRIDENGTVFPVLLENEYVENGIKGKEITAIEDVQRGALTFIKNIVCLPEWENISFSSEIAFLNMSNFANYPTKKALEMFGEFRFFNNGTVSYIAGKKSKEYSLFDIKKMKKEFYESRWRIGFLKQTFKIYLPYYLIFKVLMKIAI